MFVIPGLLHAIEGQVDGPFSPPWSTGHIHLVSITYFFDLCVVLARLRMKGIHHQPLPA